MKIQIIEYKELNKKELTLIAESQAEYFQLKALEAEDFGETQIIVNRDSRPNDVSITFQLRTENG